MHSPWDYNLIDVLPHTTSSIKSDFAQEFQQKLQDAKQDYSRKLQSVHDENEAAQMNKRVAELEIQVLYFCSIDVGIDLGCSSSLKTFQCIWLETLIRC